MFFNKPNVKVLGVVVLFPLVMAALGYFANGTQGAFVFGIFALFLAPYLLMATMGKDL